MSTTSIQANPYDVLSLHGETPSVKEYLHSLVHYTTEWDQGDVETRKKVYSMLPNIQTLTISVNGFLNQDFYLRPTIKSIHMNFKLYIIEDRKYNQFEFLHTRGFLDWFNRLEKYLLENPDSQLEELHIQFMPEVSLYLCIPNYHIVDHDEDGRICEDEEWLVKTSNYNPSAYLFILSKSSEDECALKEIGEALLQLLSIRSWKAITLYLLISS